jgi:hypothetical protein
MLEVAIRMKKVFIILFILSAYFYSAYFVYEAAFSLCDQDYFKWVKGDCIPKTSVLFLILIVVIFISPLILFLAWLINHTIKYVNSRY